MSVISNFSLFFVCLIIFLSKTKISKKVTKTYHLARWTTADTKIVRSENDRKMMSHDMIFPDCEGGPYSLGKSPICPIYVRRKN